MALLQWSDELSVGIDIIDKQHMILMRAINLLALAIEKNSERELLEAIFKTLADYTVTHFAYEEKLFDHFDYPQSIEHKKDHQALRDKVSVLKDRFDAGEDNLGPQVLKFLVEWLTKHILGKDKRYASFILEGMERQGKNLS
ncbi:MAG: bacteriohemerythrin [bacterium]|nr:bacteriohemerythrin [bacterium]